MLLQIYMKNLSKRHLHKYMSDSLGKRSLSEFAKTFRGNTFFIERTKNRYTYGIWVGMSFLCSKSGRDQIDQDLRFTDFVR